MKKATRCLNIEFGSQLSRQVSGFESPWFEVVRDLRRHDFRDYGYRLPGVPFQENPALSGHDVRFLLFGRIDRRVQFPHSCQLVIGEPHEIEKLKSPFCSHLAPLGYYRRWVPQVNLPAHHDFITLDLNQAFVHHLREFIDHNLGLLIGGNPCWTESLGLEG